MLCLAAILAAVVLQADTPLGYYRFPTIHNDTVVFTAEGDLWSVPAIGGIARRLTSHPGTEARPALSPDGRTIAFSAEYEGPTEVYTMPVAGGLPVRQTFNGGALVVGWTPDGKVLYVTRSHSTLPNEQLASVDPQNGAVHLIPLAQASEGVWDADQHALFFTRLPFQGSSTKRYQGGTAQNLWRYEPGGKEAQALTADYAGTSKNPMWWQGRIYFISDRDGIMNLWSMKPEGTDLHQLTHHRTFDVGSAALHGGRIVYQHGADLWLYDIPRDTDAPMTITLATDFDQEREKWVRKPLDYLTTAHLSPSGDRVILTARGQVFVAPVQAGRFVQVTREARIRYRQATFLPDGKSVVALSDATGELEFTKLPANGVGVPEALTHDGKIFRYAPVPSPDGKRLAWQDKNQQLWILNLDSKQTQRVATSAVQDFSDLAWSPDGNWLAYVQAATNQYRRIHLYGVKGNTQAVVTSDRVDSRSPAWSPDGKWLYFLSDRTLRSLVGSPWGQRQPEPFFAEATRIYQVALVKGLRSPFRPPDELAPPEKKKDEEKTKTDAKGQGTSGTNQPPAVSVTIDLPGLQMRVEEVPVGAGNYADLTVLAKRLVWVARDTSFEGERHLKQLEITAEDPKPKTLVEDIRDYEPSLDGKKLMIRKGDTFYVIPSDSSAPAKLDDHQLKLDGWTFPVNPRDEWRQIFVESWRMMRDYFYDRNLHGLDWGAIQRKYLPLVDRISDREELNDVIAQMVGELSALHIFVRFGDSREGPDQIKPAALGARLERDSRAGAWRVEHIYQNDPDYPGSLSPLSAPGTELENGDLITSINGVATGGEAQLERLLRNQAGRQVLLGVKPKGSGKTRQVIVKPITAEQEAELRYAEWEYTRRLQVEKLSNNRIGYVHLRAMGGADIAAWARDFYPVFQREGLIVDVRHNRGGNIDSWILEKLLRKAWFYWQPRVGNPIWNMPFAFRGHVVVLCNERTASDGEAFTEGFRRLGLGKVIGTRTWGGEIWLSAQRWLVDSGMATAAETGVYGPEGVWLIEGHGVDPDLVVDNLPHATFEGKDAQIEAAVSELQRRMANEPRPVPPTPKYPNKARP